MTSTCMTRPMPSPTTSMKTDASQLGVETPSRVSSSSPIVSTAVPAIGNIR